MLILAIKLFFVFTGIGVTALIADLLIVHWPEVEELYQEFLRYELED